MPSERNPSFYKLRYICLCKSAHRIPVDNYCRLVKVLMIMQLDPELLTHTFILVTVQHGRMNVLPGAYRGFLCYGVNMRIYPQSAGTGVISEIDKGHTHIQAVVPCQCIQGSMT